MWKEKITLKEINMLQAWNISVNVFIAQLRGLLFILQIKKKFLCDEWFCWFGRNVPHYLLTQQLNKTKWKENEGFMKCHSHYFHSFFLNRLIMRMPAFCVHQWGLKTLKVLEVAVWVSVESESGFSWAFSGFSSLYSWAKYSHLRELNLQA